MPQSDNSADVPSPINFHLPSDAAQWAATAMVKRPRGASLQAVAIMMSFYPLIACERGKARARRAALLAAGGSLALAHAIGLAQWRYGWAVSSWAWRGLWALTLAGPAVAGVLAFRPSEAAQVT